MAGSVFAFPGNIYFFISSAVKPCTMFQLLLEARGILLHKSDLQVNLMGDYNSAVIEEG